ncbi:MAG: hypothetical protein Q8N31_05110 [Reyranella sp.]|nr:hypothetical protein [Reyranella sp.]
MQQKFDRAAEDLGNAIHLEHVNIQVPDQRLATLFYVTGLGLTRDPYLMVSDSNMWVNVGRSQFHLVTGPPQQLRGRVGLVVPDREALLRRLENMRKPLKGTKFDFTEHGDHVEATCPWGNRILCHDPAPRFGRINLGMPYVEFDVPTGAAKGVADFYGRVFGTATKVDGAVAWISVGMEQELVFRETKAKLAPYDGHHIQVYVANFSGPHRELLERGLITEESNQHQYRFDSIVDLQTGKPLIQIEHEVRSMRHPLYARPLVNRNAQQTNRNYAPGHDAWIAGSAAEEMDDPRVAMRQRRFEEATRQPLSRQR